LFEFFGSLTIKLKQSSHKQHTTHEATMRKDQPEPEPQPPQPFPIVQQNVTVVVVVIDKSKDVVSGRGRDGSANAAFRKFGHAKIEEIRQLRGVDAPITDTDQKEIVDDWLDRNPECRFLKQVWIDAGREEGERKIKEFASDLKRPAKKLKEGESQGSGGPTEPGVADDLQGRHIPTRGLAKQDPAANHSAHTAAKEAKATSEAISVSKESDAFHWDQDSLGTTDIDSFDFDDSLLQVAEFEKVLDQHFRDHIRAHVEKECIQALPSPGADVDNVVLECDYGDFYEEAEFADECFAGEEFAGEGIVTPDSPERSKLEPNFCRMVWNATGARIVAFVQDRRWFGRGGGGGGVDTIIFDKPLAQVNLAELPTGQEQVLLLIVFQADFHGGLSDTCDY
jgi:hypothetical protein